MSKKSVRATSIVTLVLVLAALACGKGTTETPAKAPPAPTHTQAPGTAAKATPTRPPAKPAATNTIPPTPTLEPEPVTVIASGHGQIDQWLGVAFIVTNPNADLAIERTQYQIAVYDQSKAVVKTDSGYIEVLMPSQTLGVAARFTLSEDVQAAHVEVQLSQGKPTAAEAMPDFGVSNVTFRLGDLGSEARGIISNPLDIDLRNLRICAIAYDQAGEIVGGGWAFLSFVLAQGEAGVEVPLTSASEVTRVDLYPGFLSLSTVTRETEMPADAARPVLVKSGIGQNDDEVGYGLLVKNPNEGYAIENTSLHFTIYDADGHVMIVHEGSIPVLLPGETQGIAGVFYGQAFQIADRLDVQLLPGTYTPSAAIPSLSAENVSYQADSYTAKTTGMIVNPYDKEVSHVGVCAIAYDSAGEIVGGGVTRMDFVPAGGKAAVEVTTVSAGTPASVELYASVTQLSAIK